MFLQSLHEMSFVCLGQVNLCFHIRRKRAPLVRTARAIKIALFIEWYIQIFRNYCNTSYIHE